MAALFPNEDAMTIAIVGVGETDYRWKDPRPVAALALDATRRALDDAGLTGPDVDGFVVEAMTMGEQAPADEIAQRLGVRNRTFSTSLGIAGSGTVGAPILAELAIEAGLADVVVSYYGISLSAVRAARTPTTPETPPRPPSRCPSATTARPCTSPPPRPGTSTSSASRRSSWERSLSTREAPGGRRTHCGEIRCRWRTTWPTGRGRPFAQARLLPRQRWRGGLRHDQPRTGSTPPPAAGGAGRGRLRVQAGHAGAVLQPEREPATTAAISGPLAFKRAGLSPADVDVAEIYDCFTISALLQLEDLGFAPRGEGASFAATGALRPGGSLPMNTHGGLLSQSYVVGGNHVVEAVRQLRGERGEAQVPGAEVALVAGLGAPEHSTLILTVDR